MGYVGTCVEMLEREMWELWVEGIGMGGNVCGWVRIRIRWDVSGCIEVFRVGGKGWEVIN